MSQEEGDQPLVPNIPSPSPSPTPPTPAPTPSLTPSSIPSPSPLPSPSSTTQQTATRKLKRFRSDPTTNSSTTSTTSTSPATSDVPGITTPAPPLPPPTTPPTLLRSSTPPPSLPPPSTPPFTPDFEDPSTPVNVEGDGKEGEAPSSFARRILKIAKSAKAPEEKKPSTATTTTTTYDTVVQPGSLRPDGTMRKTIKIRTKQMPKITQASPESKPPKKKLKPNSRIRPNTNFLTRLVKSSERHNASLAALENSGSEYETIDSDGGSSDENFDEEDLMDEIEGEEEGEGDGDNIQEEFKEKVSSIVEAASQEVQKERRFIMKQIRKMRQKEGITLIKSLAKLYSLHVSIEEDKDGKERLRGSSIFSTPKPSPINRIVKSVGKIGYGGDDNEMDNISI